MANRRMFSLKIINSAKFLKMPTSTQLLYFHLGLNADDDGIVEGYNVLRMIGATEDDLKILVAKGFVIVLNEDLVSYITDWQEHNLIRADRKVDSIYKNLLLQVVGDVKLLESKPRADSKSKSNKEMSPDGRPEDTQGTKNDGIGKVRLGKDKLSKDNISSSDCDEGSIAYQLTNELMELMKRNNPNVRVPTNIDKWVLEVDKMIRLDKRSPDDIRAVIYFSQNDSFWRANILSTKKLREKFDSLYLKCNGSKGGTDIEKSRGSTSGNFVETIGFND